MRLSILSTANRGESRFTIEEKQKQQFLILTKIVTYRTIYDKSHTYVSTAYKVRMLKILMPQLYIKY